MRRKVWLPAVLLMSALLPVHGQTYFPDTITFSGTNVSQEALLAYTGLQPGPVTKEQMQAAVARLTASGLFIRAAYELNDDVLHYTLTPSPAVLPVIYDNFVWWDAKTLNALVAEKVPLFGGELYPGGPMRQQVLDALTELVAAKGVQVKIGTTPVGDAHGTMTATRFHIDSPPVVIGAFTVEGVGEDWAEAVGRVEQAAAGRASSAATPDALAAEVGAVYRDRGYLDVAVTDPEWGTPQVVDGKVVAPLTEHITNVGQPYTVAAVRFAGDAQTSAEAFAKLAKIHAGDVADDAAIQAEKDLLADPWKAKGYLDAQADTGEQKDSAHHTVTYTLTVNPGVVYHMGKLTLIGLNQEQEKQVRMYWQMAEGAVFEPALVPQWSVAYQRMRAPELVVAEKLEKMIPEYENQANHDTHVVDVVIRFKPANVVPQPFDFHPTWH